MPAQGLIALRGNEITRLAKCESTIEQGLASFVDVGCALNEIRTRKLHKGTHVNFKDYVRERWNMSGTHAFRLIGAAETVEKSPIGDSIPNEAIARELTDVPPEQHKAVLEVASEDGAPTAASIRDAVAASNGEKKPAKPRKQGTEKLGHKTLKECREHLGKLTRSLDKAGILEELRDPMNIIAKRLNRK